MRQKKILFIIGLSLLILSHPSLSILIPSQFDPNGEIRFSLGGEVSVLNPILSTDSASSAVEGAIFSGLVRVNEKLEMIPDLATKWEVSKDGKIWTFYLRKNVKWHDGVQFTAEDVKFTFDSILNPKINSVRRSDYIIEGKPIQFKVADKYKVQAILPKPYAPFLSHAGMSIIPKHLLSGKDINTAEFNRHPVGTGPFIFKEWKTGDHVTLIRNDNYYFGKPLLAKITYKIIPDENSNLVALEAGEVDEAGIPAKDYSRMKKVKEINVFEFDALTYVYLGLNLDSPKFADKRVRQALAYATDKKQLVNLIFRGLASPAYAPSAPVSWAYNANVPKYAYDPEKAKKILKEAKAENLEFTILVNQGNKEREKAAVILQQQYKKVGVKVKVRVLEWSALLKVINAPTGPKDFDAVIIGWSLGLDPDGYSIWHSSQYPKGFNFIGYKNPVVDKLLEQGRTTIDRKGRKAIYAKLWKTIADDQPYIFLWYPKAVSGISTRVGGLSNPGPAGMFLNLEKVFISPK
ncbi:MAG: peptide-binding protein [Candidatus Margulisiibacteriota bacterium]